MNALARLTPDTLQAAEALATKIGRLASFRTSGDELTARILADLEKLRDLPADVLAQEKDVEADAVALGRQIAADLAAPPPAA